MLQLQLQPFPVLETENLILKAVTHADAAAFLDMRSNTTVMQYIPRPIMQNAEEATTFIDNCIDNIAQNEYIHWGIYYKSQPNEMLGSIGYYRTQLAHYRSEIGYSLREKYFSKGIMQEAIATVIAYGFETIQLHTIEAVIDPANIASQKLLVRNGFVQEGHFLENELWQGKWLDTLVLTLHRKNYKKN
jgi:[ribosomal protein S5]-alanine N-acetyltransferase